MNLTAVIVSIGLIALSAFFVAIEFALVAARRYRLEEAAETSASARAALRSARDLSLLLAGSQLGITLCTLGLGAVAKPAVDEALEPLLVSWGLPTATAGVLAFVLSMVVVTFLHLVVGEMAPKSWAISHPERSATLLALPMRGFMFLTRPLLVALNGIANWCLHRVGVEPVDEVGAGRNPDDLRELVDHSARAGALDQGRHDQLLTAMELDSAPLRELVRDELAAVAIDDRVQQIREVSRTSGHLRLVVRDGAIPVGVVHVRDTLTRAPETTARDLMRPVLTLTGEETAYAALGIMRQQRSHLALVRSEDRLLGLVTMQDLLDRLLPAEPEPAGA
ncbi:hemolysin family protein [Pseudonocardia acidicola]|uniref:HlyC/CorC family transporter n=1 Tax=Pseudonocardia acidicola TaxID=2724939 RepID=A0ABX1S4Y9_9PSEU|nr:hemolysin family protein [Pseudonocardia acidicola]NMH96655.1 HlyC/CorC family transporter [Pseudonocardia acidicola]